MHTCSAALPSLYRRPHVVRSKLGVGDAIKRGEFYTFSFRFSFLKESIYGSISTVAWGGTGNAKIILIIVHLP